MADFPPSSPLTVASFRPGLEQHHSEGSIWWSQFPRRPDVQVGEDDGRGAVPGEHGERAN